MVDTLAPSRKVPRYDSADAVSRLMAAGQVTSLCEKHPQDGDEEKTDKRPPALRLPLLQLAHCDRPASTALSSRGKEGAARATFRVPGRLVGTRRCYLRP